jgi:cellulose synthase/poly-beta-1,6-N-acetylglucosamine synthase-like glycosyltransferase
LSATWASSASFPTKASCFTASCRTATTSGTRPSSAAPARCCAATALDEIGGIAVETVTEDAHTSLRMQMNGWGTAYINIPQAAGLATERLSAHVGQRIRWARGMIQILRTDNPLFAPGLKLAQRLCYFNAMATFSTRCRGSSFSPRR